MSEVRQRRSAFFELRGVLGFVLLAFLATHPKAVSPHLWVLGIAFLLSNLLILIVPASKFENPAFAYAIFFVDLTVLTVFFWAISAQSESLLLYYLTVFMATLGGDLRKSIAIAVVAAALFVGFRLSQGGTGLWHAEALLHIPLFFVTAVSTGYLAQQVGAHKRRIGELKEVHKSMEFQVETSSQALTRSEDQRVAAQELARRFVALVDGLDAIIWEADAATLTSVFVSRRAEEILGYPAEQWIRGADFWMDHIHPGDRERTAAAFRAALEAGTEHELEYRMMASDGRVVWFRNKIRVIREANGVARWVRGVMLDITQQKLAEERDLLFALSLDMMCIAGFDGYFKRLNPAWEKTLGYTRNELLGRPFIEFIHPDDREATRAEAQKLAGGEVTISFENRYRSKDGSYKWFVWTAAPLLERRLIYAVARDHTERKRAENQIKKLNDELERRVAERTTQWERANRVLQGEIAERNQAEKALRESEERFRLFVEHAPAAIAMFDRDMRYVAASRRWLTDYHLGDREIIGRSHDEVFPTLPDSWKGIHQRCLAGAVEKCEEDSFIGADGNTEWMRWEIRPWRDQGGAIAGTLLFSEVITERKKLEEQLRQSQKIEAIGQLAGGVAHDFNNLLTIISGYSQLMVENPEAGDAVRAHANEIMRASDRAASLTRQLLAFSRRQVLAPQVLDLNEVVANVDKMLRRLIGEPIDLVTRLEPHLGTVKADPGQIEQVIMNLAVNARDAMADGGKLTLETANVELDDAYVAAHPPAITGPYVMLAVSDTGTGMDAETQAHMFEPFFTTKGPGKGTGLGLATVYGIVKQSNGYIWVYSEPGRGTAFKIYLPRVDEAATHPEAGEQPRVTHRAAETVLLVEDEVGVRSLVREVLNSGGYTVLEATRGDEAIGLCAAHPGLIHLLLTDVIMPQMSGRELATRLTTLYPHLKVLFMSGYTNEGIVHNGVLERNTAFLSKPFTPSALASKVREVLDARPESNVSVA